MEIISYLNSRFFPWGKNPLNIHGELLPTHGCDHFKEKQVERATDSHNFSPSVLVQTLTFNCGFYSPITVGEHPWVVTVHLYRPWMFRDFLKATIITPGSRNAGRNVSREEKAGHFLVERRWFYSLWWCERSERCSGLGCSRNGGSWLDMDSYFHCFCSHMICVMNVKAAIRKIWKHHFLPR